VQKPVDQQSLTKVWTRARTTENGMTSTPSPFRQMAPGEPYESDAAPHRRAGFLRMRCVS
jgi:hypothetical protein